MSEWRRLSEPPANWRFKVDELDPDYADVRVLVAVEDSKEARKGTCIRRPGKPLKWLADGISGDYVIYAWMPLPTPPPYTEV